MRILLLALLGCGHPSADSGAVVAADTGMVPFFASQQACARCHPRQVAEWEQSMHAYAAQSPVFDAMAGKAFRDTSGAVGTFCTGCHTPQGTLEGEPGSTVAAGRSALSLEGVTCDVCHTAVGHDGLIGNAAVIRDLGGPRRGPYEAEPNPYHESAVDPFVASSDLCGSCHDVFVFPGLRIEEAFTEFQESPAAEAGLRCQDCHMGAEPGIPGERPLGPSAVVDGVEGPDREQAAHYFVGPDVALIDDFPYPDDLEASALAQEAYRAKAESLLQNAARIADVRLVASPAGARLEVDVESLVSGHRVPTGFTSERQMWLHTRLTDASGELVMETGQLDLYGDLCDSHSLQVLSGEVVSDTSLVNFQSTNLAVARAFLPDGTFDNAPDAFHGSQNAIFPFDASAIIRNSLEPLELRTVDWPLAAPGEAPWTATVTLRYRAMPPYVLRALGLDALIDRVPIFEMDASTVEITADEVVVEEGE